jgi:hypothetical protein
MGMTREVMVEPPKSLQPGTPGRMNNLIANQLRAFIAAAEPKSISRAAEQLFLTRSVFSPCIHELELSVGEAVFKRTAHGVTLLPAGEVLLPYAKRLLQSYGAAASARDGLQGVFLQPVAWLLVRKTTQQTARARLVTDRRELCRGSLRVALTCSSRVWVRHLQIQLMNMQYPR